jgi:CSLREA domain-containing protein
MSRFIKSFRYFVILVFPIFFFLSFIQAETAVGDTFVVNTTGDTGDNYPTDGICRSGSGEACTLRAAIEQANFDPNTIDTIVFDIPTGLLISKIIPIGSALPDISSPMTIQGPNISDGEYIVLNGDNLSFSGLTITSSNVTIEEIVVSQFGGYGIKVENANHVIISDSNIGAFQRTRLLDGNGSQGIFINNGSEVSVIDNVIKGNGSDGILIQEGGNNLIKGNFIGVDIAGTDVQPNEGNGIRVNQSNFNHIGGHLPDGVNIISGNLQSGIMIEGGSIETTIMGNYIGTNIVGTALEENQSVGIDLVFATSTIIGGEETGEGNLISGNLGDGVRVQQSSTNNLIVGNSIIGNGGLGINLAIEGEAPSCITSNDPGDIDSGANQLQNFPVLTRIGYYKNGTSVMVEGVLDSQPLGTYSIHFYGNDTCDTSGYGEGQVYLGMVNVSTDSNHQANFVADLSLTKGYSCITATATDHNGNTSEFSSNEAQFRIYFPLFTK